MLRGSNVVGRQDLRIGKGREMVSQAFKLTSLGDPGKDLLPDQAQEDNSAVANELLPGLDVAILRSAPSGRATAKR